MAAGPPVITTIAAGFTMNFRSIGADVTPVTALGKIFAGFTAIAGIGMIAMPTGILAAAFSEAMQRRRATESVDREGRD